MIRAFTISFDFEGKTYLALATVDATRDNVSYFVRLHDDHLSRIIPGGNLHFSDTQTFENSPSKHPSAKLLFTCISRSIEDHLHCCEHIKQA